MMTTNTQQFDNTSPAHVATAKLNIRQQFERAVKLAVSTSALEKPLTSDHTQAICTVIEAIFVHGLKDAFFLKGSRYSKRPMPNFWPFVSKYTHRSIKQQIAALNQIHSEVGKARAWIRIVLSENALEHYVSLFAKDTQVRQFYDKLAFLRDLDCIESLNTYLKLLNRLQIEAPINSSLLNNWTPSPLVLAGLVQGKDVKVILPPNHQPANAAKELNEDDKDGDDTTNLTAAAAKEATDSPEEVGTNALDLLLLTPPGSSHQNQQSELEEEEEANASFSIAGANFSGANFPGANVNPNSSFDQSPFDRAGMDRSFRRADDLESVLSHPSMLMDYEEEEDESSTTFFNDSFEARGVGGDRSAMSTTSSTSRQPQAQAVQQHFGKNYNKNNSNKRNSFETSFETPVLDTAGAGLLNISQPATTSKLAGLAGRRSPQAYSWMEQLAPAEEHSTEVVVHRRKTGRRRAVSKSSDGDNSTRGSRSRTQSTSNLYATSTAENEPPMECEVESKAGGGEEETPFEEHNTLNKMLPASALGEQQRHSTIEEEKSALLEQHKMMMTTAEATDEEEEEQTARALAEALMREQQQQTFAMENVREELKANAAIPPAMIAHGQRMMLDDDMELPLGTSLQDELLLASHMEADQKQRPTAAEDVQHFRLRKSSEPPNPTAAAGTSLKTTGREEFADDQRRTATTFTAIYSTDSSSTDLPGTFDEALREFLTVNSGGKDGDGQRKDREGEQQMFGHSMSDKRLFSECSSSSNGGETPMTSKGQPQQQEEEDNEHLETLDRPPSIDLTLKLSASPTNMLPSADGETVNRSSAADAELKLSPSLELAKVALETVVQRAEQTTEDGDQLVEILPFLMAETSVINFDLSTKPTGPDREPYLIPKRLLHLTQLPLEQGLDKQNFRCKSCRRNIGAGFGPFRVCALTGLYHCEGCVRNGEECLIPARAILNCDFRPQPISKDSKTLLRSIADRPLFRVDMLNPSIYDHSKQMRKIRDARRKLSLLVMYLLSCKNNVAEDMNRRLWPNTHLHADIHLYSFIDLESLANGTMERRLNSLISFALSHIQNCPLCLQKGFFCELCSSERPIYPFMMEITYQCPRCSSCFHRECARKAGLLLPTTSTSNSKKTSTASSSRRESSLYSNNNSSNNLNQTSLPQLQQQPNCPKCLRRVKYSSPALSASLSRVGSPASSPSAAALLSMSASTAILPSSPSATPQQPSPSSLPTVVMLLNEDIDDDAHDFSASAAPPLPINAGESGADGDVEKAKTSEESTIRNRSSEPPLT